MSDQPINVLVAGTVQISEGHSNVEHKIRLLSQAKSLNVRVAVQQIRFKINYSSKIRQLTSITSLLIKLSLGVLSTLATIVKHRAYTWLYLPYPGHLATLALSFLPRRFAPDHIILDLFISLYDTVVTDRSLLKNNSLLARVLYWAETRVLSRVQVCLVDTEENAIYYSKLFNKPRQLFKTLPLSIDNKNFRPLKIPVALAEVTQHRPLRLLFAGTMVPLQGVPYLCNTIKMLKECADIEFVLIGNGQDSMYIRRLLEELAAGEHAVRVRWEQNWLDSKNLAKEIHLADVCLGIFGHTAKAARVWPFKNYLYMACGKMLITADTATSVRLSALSDEPAFIPVDLNDANSLGNILRDIIDKPGQIKTYGEQARIFYDRLLSDEVILHDLVNLMKQPNLENSQ